MYFIIMSEVKRSKALPSISWALNISTCGHKLGSSWPRWDITLFIVHKVGSFGNSWGSNLGGAGAGIGGGGAGTGVCVLVACGIWIDSIFPVGPGWTEILFSGLGGGSAIRW